MLFLNYEDINQSLFPLWKEFLERMDQKDIQCIGPEGNGIEKAQKFSTFAEHGEKIFPLIEKYLTDDNNVALDVRRAIFFDTLKKAETIGVFSSLENTSLLFNHEQSESFKTYVNSKKVLQECIVELNKESRHRGELNMNLFFIQLNMEKIQKNISEYEKRSKQYVLLDPLKYLTIVITDVLEHSHKECLRYHRGELSVSDIVEDVRIESVLVENPISEHIKQRRNLDNEIDREIQKQNQYYMNRIANIYGKKL